MKYKKEGFLLLAATSKVSSRGLVSFEILEAIHSLIAGLPVKEKKFYKTPEAVDYLFHDIHDAIVNKNYTIEDISEYFIASGWHISHTALKKFWRAFRGDMEKYRTSQLLSDKKGRKKHAKSVTDKTKKLSPVVISVAEKDCENNIKNSSEIHQNNYLDDVQKSVVDSTKDNIFLSHSSAHFVMPPDTEDL